MVSKQRAIREALAYSDLFHFPLTFDEIWIYLPPSNIKKRELVSLVHRDTLLATDGTYVAFQGEEKIITLRQEQESRVLSKREGAQKIAQRISILPWIQCICLSGSLAAGQYKPQDDIDFFIITKPGTLWLSRVCLLIFLQVIGKRRRRESLHAPGSICLNMFVDLEGMDMSVLGKDIYIAREVVQLKPLINKRNTYEQFLSKNQWVRAFLPHALSRVLVHYSPPLVSPFSQFFNGIFKFLQLVHIRKHLTTEYISEHLVAFHPSNYHERILAQFVAKKRTIPH